MKAHECRYCHCGNVAPGRILCHDCEQHIPRSLETIRRLWPAALDNAYRTVKHPVEGPRAPRSNPGLPVSTWAWGECERIVGMLREPLLVVLRHARLHIKPLGFETVPDACRLMLAGHSILQTAQSEHDGDAAEWVNTLRRAARMVRRLADDEPHEQVVAIGACPYCRGVLMGHAGDGEGVCTQCWHRCKPAPGGVYATLTADQRIGYPTDISRLLAALGLHVPASTIRSWIHRGRLTVDAQGMIRLADVARLLDGRRM